MDDPTRHSSSVRKSRHSSFAGRLPAGTQHAVTLKKDGVRHVSVVCHTVEKLKEHVVGDE